MPSQPSRQVLRNNGGCMAGTDGRLIRVAEFRGDPKAAAYVVAVSDKATALSLIREKIGQPGDDIEDLGNAQRAIANGIVLGARWLCSHRRPAARRPATAAASA